jgi:LPS export ABC transporter permease LptG
MIWLQHLFRALRAVAHRARTWPYLGRSAFALGLIVMLLAWTQGHHLDHPPEVVGYELQNGELVAHEGVRPVGPLIKAVSLMLPYLDFWMQVGGVLFVFVLLRQWGNVRKLVFPAWVAAVSVAAWAIATDLASRFGNMQMSEMGEPPAVSAYWVKLGMILLASLCVPFLLQYYARSLTLERYTLRTFLRPLVFCFVAFCSLWMIMDLLDNLKDFQDAKTSLGRVFLFYVRLVPFIFVSVMPAALLLAMLYTLTQMSRSNEIVAMLTAGRSIRQILKPMFVVVLTVALLSMAANYYWSPRAEGNREAIVRALSARQQDSIMASAVLYRDPLTKRVWFVSSFPFSLRDGRERLHGVRVQEEDAQGKLVRTIVASSAMWWQSGLWRFYDGQEVLYRDGRPQEIKPFPLDASGRSVLDARGLKETPWKMVSFALQPDYMGVPEIESYLKAHPKDPPEKLAPFHAHFHHRFALPWQSLALAMMAAPLGITYSRRGAVGGIAASIFMFFAILFLSNLFLNLGKGAHMPPWLSPWMPHLVFGTLGLLLLHYRSQNKDFPKISLHVLLGRKAKVVRSRNSAAAA